MRSPLALALAFLSMALLGAPMPAAAHDWLGQWRAMRAEYLPEFKRARMMGQLDCAELNAYVAEQNWWMNQRVYAEYHRLTPPPVPAAAPTQPPR